MARVVYARRDLASCTGRFCWAARYALPLPLCAAYVRCSLCVATMCCHYVLLLCVANVPRAIHCSLFVVRCSLFTVHCSLFTVHCSLFTVHCSLSVGHWSFWGYRPKMCVLSLLASDGSDAWQRRSWCLQADVMPVIGLYPRHGAGFQISACYPL